MTSNDLGLVWTGMNHSSVHSASEHYGKGTFVAYNVIDGKYYRVFPARGKRTVFTTIDAAAQRLERMTINNSFDSRGIVVEATSRVVVLTMAL